MRKNLILIQKNKIMLDVETIKQLIPYFNYLFDSIDWNYEELIENEQIALSKELFEKIKEIKIQL